jgi:hypothetical protein
MPGEPTREGRPWAVLAGGWREGELLHERAVTVRVMNTVGVSNGAHRPVDEYRERQEVHEGPSYSRKPVELTTSLGRVALGGCTAIAVRKA